MKLVYFNHFYIYYSDNNMIIFLLQGKLGYKVERISVERQAHCVPQEAGMCTQLEEAGPGLSRMLESKAQLCWDEPFLSHLAARFICKVVEPLTL